MDLGSAADARYSITTDETRRTAMLGMYFKPAVAGIDYVYLQPGFDLADLLGELSGRGKDSSVTGDLIGADKCPRCRLGVGLACRVFLNSRPINERCSQRCGFATRSRLMLDRRGCGNFLGHR